MSKRVSLMPTDLSTNEDVTPSLDSATQSMVNPKKVQLSHFNDTALALSLPLDSEHCQEILEGPEFYPGDKPAFSGPEREECQTCHVYKKHCSCSTWCKSCDK